MNKTALLLTLFFILSISNHLYSQNETKQENKNDLEEKLEKLKIDSSIIPEHVDQKKLRVKKLRYSSLHHRHEFALGGGYNVLAEPHLETQNTSLSYRFHLNNSSALGFRGGKVFNNLSESGEDLFRDQMIIPDSDFAKSYREVNLFYNITHGKLKVSDFKLMYFDFFGGIGYGDMELANKTTRHYSLELGLAFWLGKNFSIRPTVRNEFYQQKTRFGEKDTHNAFTSIELGVLL